MCRIESERHITIFEYFTNPQTFRSTKARYLDAGHSVRICWTKGLPVAVSRSCICPLSFRTICLTDKITIQRLHSSFTTIGRTESPLEFPIRSKKETVMCSTILTDDDALADADADD